MNVTKPQCGRALGKVNVAKNPVMMQYHIDLDRSVKSTLSFTTHLQYRIIGANSRYGT